LKRLSSFAAIVWLACGPAFAQEVSAPPATTNDAGATLPHLPAGSIVHIELLDPLSSKTNKRGDMFRIALAQPIITPEGVLVPAGATGMGQVVSAAHKGYGGQAGELVLAARYIDFAGQRIPLRSFQLSGTGGDNTGGMNWCRAIFTYCASLATDLEIPAGFKAEAKLAADLSLPIIAPAPIPDATPLSSSVQPAENQ
jgi:hypothetical protein